MKKFFFALLLFFIAGCNDYVWSGEPAEIKRIKIINERSMSKVQIELSSSISLPVEIFFTDSVIKYRINGILPKKDIDKILNKKADLSKYQLKSDGFINKVKLYPSGNDTILEIHRDYFSPADFEITQKPHRLIIKFPQSYYLQNSFNLKKGITRHLVRTVSKKGPLVINIIEIDLANKNISFKAGLPDVKTIKSKQTLSEIVKNNKAYIGINANYFDVKVGNPLGTTITKGSWLIGSVYNRVAIGFSENNMVFIDQIQLKGTIDVFRGFKKKQITKLDLNALNIPIGLYEGVGLFTRNWDKKIVIPSGKTALIVKYNHVEGFSEGEAEIPEKGYVLAGNKGFTNLLKKNDLLKIIWESTPDWSQVQEAVSGGPYLIMGGHIYIDQKEQKFKFAVKDTYAARAAIGVDGNQKLYLIAVDGKNSSHSVGMTLKELAEVLKKLNLEEAINLDGGGSTTLVIDGKVINSLSDRHERKISAALLVIYDD